MGWRSTSTPATTSSSRPSTSPASRSSSATSTRARGWVVDAAFAGALAAGVDYVLNLDPQGHRRDGHPRTATCSAASCYNSGVADGEVGTVAKAGTTSVDRFRIRTDDSAFAGFLPPPELRIGDAAVTEGSTGATLVTLTLTLSSPVASATSVGWRTVDGTALAGSDYTGVTSGTATFAAGSASTTITVAVNGDTSFEPDEAFTVELTKWTGFNLADRAGVVTIANDDVPPVVTVATSDALGERAGHGHDHLHDHAHDGPDQRDHRQPGLGRDRGCQPTTRSARPAGRCPVRSSRCRRGSRPRRSG